MPVDDELSLRIVGRYQSQNVVNTLHYLVDTQASADNGLCDSLITAFSATVESAWLDAHESSYNLEGYKAYVKKGNPLVPGLQVIDSPGTVIGTSAPAAVCRTITLYTTSANRRKRGRVMLSGSDTSDFLAATGAVSSGARALMDDIGDLLLPDLANGGDIFKLILPTVGVVAYELVTGFLSRVTPALVSSRRIRRFLIG